MTPLLRLARLLKLVDRSLLNIVASKVWELATRNPSLWAGNTEVLAVRHRNCPAPTPMIIRRSILSDWEAIAEVYDSAKPDELAAAGIPAAFVCFNDDPIAQDAIKALNILVAVDEDERVIGFGGFTPEHIGSLFVHRAFRHRGVGRALLRAMLEKLCGVAWLWILQGNAVAYRLYIQEGFEARETARVSIHQQTCQVLKLVRHAPNGAKENERAELVGTASEQPSD